MRIFLVVVYYLPSTKSCAKLVHDLALEFKILGHEVTVITPDENIETDVVVNYVEEVRVLRVKTGKIDGATRIKRALNELLLSRTIWKRGKNFFKNNKCDLIVWYSPSIFFGGLVRNLKKLNKAASYLVLRDIFPQWALDTGVLKKGPVFWYFRKRELEQYNAADIIGVQSPGNLNFFKEKEWDKKFQLEVLYNWTKTLEFNISKTCYREKLGLKDKVVFFYGGNLGVAQDMDNVLRLAEAVKDETNAFFLLVGEGTEKQRLHEIIKSKHLNNILIHKAVDQQEYFSMLSEFDAGLISLHRKFKTSNFPGKMLGYMYFSMPVLATINAGNDLQQILEQNEAGLVSINGDDDLLKQNAIKLIRSIDERLRIGLNGRKLLETTFSVSRASKQILSHFENTVNN